MPIIAYYKYPYNQSQKNDKHRIEHLGMRQKAIYIYIYIYIIQLGIFVSFFREEESNLLIYAFFYI